MDSPTKSSAASPSRLELNQTVTGDAAAEFDSLGFNDYVEAIAQFLISPSTRAPLTLSVEGEWGSGKSTFMKLLEKRLLAEGKRAVSFNAWRYDKDEAMWAAFATVALKQYVKDTQPWMRLRGHWRLWWARRDLVKMLPDLAKVSVAGIGIIVLVSTAAASFFVVPNEGGSSVSNISGWLTDLRDQAQTDCRAWGSGLAAAIAAGWQRGVKRFGNPLAIDLNKHLDSPDYSGKVAFLDKFHEDFKRVLQAYAATPGEPLYVFIDDLDRCDTPKAADLLQMLHLMVSEANQLVVILGMDRDKVAASVAVKHEKLIPMLSRSTQPNPLEYGYSFIEKFIQLPFRVPQPKPDNVESYLKSLSGDVKLAPLMTPLELGKGVKGILVPTPTAVIPVITEVDPEMAAETAKRLTRVEVYTRADSTEFQQVALMAAQFLEFNPRRIKQFVNLYRMQLYLAAGRGLFDDPIEPGQRALTPALLGKFVALSMICPRILPDLEEEPMLLSRLQELVDSGVEIISLDTPKDGAERRSVLTEKRFGNELEDRLRASNWFFREEVRNILSHFPTDGASNQEDWGFRSISVESLVQVTPATRQVGAPPAEQMRESISSEPQQHSLRRAVTAHTEEDIVQPNGPAFTSDEVEIPAFLKNFPPPNNPEHGVSQRDDDLDIPAFLRQSRVQSTSDKQPSAIPTLGHVIWIDDHPENNTSLAARLQRDGVVVTQILHESEFTSALREGLGIGPRLVVTDMGHESDKGYDESAGLESVRFVRRFDSGIPIHVYCARDLAKKYRQQALEAGAAGITSNGDELVKRVLEYFRRASAPS